jgi:hypothetical protein
MLIILISRLVLSDTCFTSFVYILIATSSFFSFILISYSSNILLMPL